LDKLAEFFLLARMLGDRSAPKKSIPHQNGTSFHGPRYPGGRLYVPQSPQAAREGPAVKQHPGPFFIGGDRKSTCESCVRNSFMLKTSPPPKLDRNRVDLSTKGLTRQWCKYFGKSTDEIEAAIAKVGDNAETVQKELQSKPKSYGR
jgi:hypothetical protein